MLKLIDLASRPDFRVGPLFVSPARRLVEGPAGETTVEPLVMKAFLLLLEAHGQVVTRDELFDTCWGGAMVGDDSLNRAIARVRKIGADTGPGLFEITAIPRTGYRMTGEIVDSNWAGQREETNSSSDGLPRRRLLGGAAAVAVTAAAGGALWYSHQRRSEEFEALMAEGKQALDYGHPSKNPVPFFQKAVELRPKDAAANGLLALAYAFNAETGGGDVSSAVTLGQQAASVALSLDSTEPNASAALVALQSSMLDLITTEERLLSVLRTDPRDTYPMPMLWGLYQSTGRSRDAFALVERAIDLKPLAAAYNYPRAQLLWILGRSAEADRVIDRAIQYWPEHPFVRFARFIITAYTGRPRIALAILSSDDMRPQTFSPALVALWRLFLRAFEDPTPANVAAARAASLEQAPLDDRAAVQSIMALSFIGDVDAAFEIANNYLLFRNPVAATVSAAPPVRSTSWRFTPGLFTPPAARLRADPRFKALCDGIGLTDYWHKRGVKPDYQVGGV